MAVEGTRQVRLGDLGIFNRGRGGTKADERTDGVPCVRYGDLYTHHDAVIRDFSSFIDPASVHRYTPLKKGDVVFAGSGETHEEIGKGAVYLGEGDAFAGADTIIFRPRAELDPIYIGYAVNTDEAARFKARFGQGSSVIHIAAGHLCNLPLFVPPLSHQRRIAKILDTIDEAIRKTEQVIEKLKAMKLGLLHDLLTRGIDDNGELRPPPSEARHLYKDSPLGMIPREWEVRPLATVANIDRGKFTHRPRNDPRFYGGAIPFIQTGDITSAEGGILHSFSQTLNPRGAAVSKEFPSGTVAITIAANIADTAILGVPMFFPDSVVGAVVHHPNNVRFVELSIRRAKLRLEAQAPQSAQKNINLQDLRPLFIAFPCPEEQDRVAEVYSLWTSQTAEEQRQLTKLRTLKRGLMDDLLTGRVRVKVVEKGVS